MNRSAEVEIKVGVFVAMGLALVMATILLLGGGQTLFSRSASYYSEFAQIEGVIEGASVKLSGIKVGQVTKIALQGDTGHVHVHFTVGRKYVHAIKQDSLVGLATQGVLGDRYLVISTGTFAAPLAPEGSEIKAELPKDFKDYLTDADAVIGKLRTTLVHLDSILGSFHRESRAETFFKNITGFSTNVSGGTKNLRESMDHLKSIMGKVDSGQGTLGALVNDPTLYEDMRALLGGANRSRVLKYFVRKSVEESREAAAEAQKQQQQKK